jgi:hypothetical protein
MSVIQRLKEVLPPLPVVLEESGVKLRRNVSDHVALCPFHKEKTPSFHVSQRYGEWRFHCFGCGIEGDGLDFQAAISGRRVEDIIGPLAREHGLERDKRESPAESMGRRKRKAEQERAQPEADFFWAQINASLARRISALERDVAAANTLPADLSAWACAHLNDTSESAEAKFAQIFRMLAIQQAAAEYSRLAAAELREAQSRIWAHRNARGPFGAHSSTRITLDSYMKQKGEQPPDRPLYGTSLVDFYLQIARRVPGLRKKIKRDVDDSYEAAQMVIALLVVAEERHSIYDPRYAQSDIDTYEAERQRVKRSASATLGAFEFNAGQGLPENWPA